MSVKDPFGFANRLTYNDDVRLLHSTLGCAELEYDSEEDKAIFRPDVDESGTDPTTNGWYVQTSSTGNVTMNYDDVDVYRGRVLHVETDTGGDIDAHVLIREENASDNNPNDVKFGVTDRWHVSLWAKNANTGQEFNVIATVKTSVGDRIMNFSTTTGSDSKSGAWLTYPIGTRMNDGEWHYLEVDLADRLDDLESGATMQEVYGIRIRCNDLFVDDIIVGGGGLEHSYSIVPTASLGAYLGVQVGDADNWDQWYHHYNDLGTVVAATDETGAKIGVYEPDLFGNYDYIDGTRPDDLGLTSKFFDSEAGLYYFNARWYDSERGRCMSNDPVGFAGGVNLYAFSRNNGLNFVDPSGLCAARDQCLANALDRYNLIWSNNESWHRISLNAIRDNLIRQLQIGAGIALITLSNCLRLATPLLIRRCLQTAGVAVGVTGAVAIAAYFFDKNMQNIRYLDMQANLVRRYSRWIALCNSITCDEFG